MIDNDLLILNLLSNTRYIYINKIMYDSNDMYIP